MSLLFRPSRQGVLMLSPRVLRTLAALAFVPLGGSTFAKEVAAHHWSYNGPTGPTHWATLEHEFGACGSGQQQSPIDIRPTAVQEAKLPSIGFSYAPGSFIDVDGHRYQLVQFHFHKPSEESINGKRHDMVAHLVHQDADGRLAVVAVLLKSGAINPMVATLWNNL